MADQVEIRFPKTEVDEKTTHTATVNFRTRSTKAASAPTTIHYRVDCLSTRQAITEWTSVSAAAEASIVLSVADNTIQDRTKTRERKQLTVKADDGLSTQQIKAATWWVRNIYGVS